MTICFIKKPYAKNLSTNETGIIGLNTIPSARMDEAGTIRIGTGTSDPYLHGFLGFQITDSVYISLRQTAEVSSLSDTANRVYPGTDLKFKLLSETTLYPQISIGFDSAFGHKKLSSEYIALSKKYKNIDMTAGIAWGRLGSAGHLRNPLKSISSHFEKERLYDNESSQGFNDWFTGKNIGLFGGIEYQTPINGLSLKADYGANNYIGSKNIDGFRKPSPWSFGFNYQPWEKTDISLSTIGGDKIMGRLSLQGNTKKWIGRGQKENYTPSYYKEGDKTHTINLSGTAPAAKELGRTVKNIKTSNISINLQYKGLKGRNINLTSHDIEQIKKYSHKTSPEEIWHNAAIKKQKTKFKNKKHPTDLRLFFHNKISLAEDEAGPLYRSSIVAQYEKPTFLGFHLGFAGKINIHNNLPDTQLHQNFSLNIRRDEYLFADKNISIDRFYTNWRGNITNDLYASVSAGYLEEMFSGYGGQFLYRPFGKTFAIGAEAWRVQKRNPFSDLSLQLNEDRLTTGHINLFYEVPNQYITAYTSIGKYLGDDFGVTAGLKTRFNNGVTLNGFITASDQEDIDLFGGTSNIYSGVRLSLPIGNTPYIPNGSAINLDVMPFTRDSGQKIDKPVDLYEATEPFSYRQIHQSWSTLLD